MKYQLVFQFPCCNMERFDHIVRLKDEIGHILRYFADVDGHDCGMGEMNIFVFTKEPQEAFERAKIVIENFGLLPEMSAAYRPIDAEEYVRMWPLKSDQPFCVA